MNDIRCDQKVLEASAVHVSPRAASRRQYRVLAVRALAVACLTVAGISLLDLGTANSAGPRSALPGKPLLGMLGQQRNKPFFWRKDLMHRIMHKNQAQAEQLLGPPDGIFKHGDGRQLWFYHRVSADRHTRTVDGMTVLKISPDGRVNHIAFRKVG